MTIVLKNQIEASEKSAEELEEEIQRDHRRAMLCLDIENLARTVATLFHDLNRDVDKLQATAAADIELREQLEKSLPEWDGLYRRLAGIFQKTAGLIRAIERWEFVVEGKSEFLGTWRELRGTVSFSQDRVAAAASQLSAGKGHSLSEVRDELWGDPLG